FAGINGPASNPGALGLSLTDVEFGLALMKVKAPAAPAVTTDLRSWLALKATVGSASFIGIDGLTVEVTTLSVIVNQGSGTRNGVANTKVVDFTSDAMDVRTG